jgi:uncharacterized protein DUF1360
MVRRNTEQTRMSHSLEADAVVRFAIDALASYRITRLLVSDGVIERPRTVLLDKLQARGHNKLVELIECPWCTGFWVAGGIVLARRTFPRAWAPLSEVLALSAAAGLIASRVRSLDDTHDVVVERVEEPDRSLLNA